MPHMPPRILESSGRRVPVLLAALALLIAGSEVAAVDSPNPETVGDLEASGEDTTSPKDDYPDWEDDEVAQSGAEPDAASADVFSLVLVEPTSLLFETHGSADTFGVLTDEKGFTIARDDDGGEGANFRIGLTLDAGRYVLAVSLAEGSSTAFTLEVVSVRH